MNLIWYRKKWQSKTYFFILAVRKRTVKTELLLFHGSFSVLYKISDYHIEEKIEAPITVQSPHTTIARLLIAPSTSPISIALAVPTA